MSFNNNVFYPHEYQQVFHTTLKDEKKKPYLQVCFLLCQKINFMTVMNKTPTKCRNIFIFIYLLSFPRKEI